MAKTKIIIIFVFQLSVSKSIVIDTSLKPNTALSFFGDQIVLKIVLW